MATRVLRRGTAAITDDNKEEGGSASMVIDGEGVPTMLRGRVGKYGVKRGMGVKMVVKMKSEDHQ